MVAAESANGIVEDAPPLSLHDGNASIVSPRSASLRGEGRLPRGRRDVGSGMYAQATTVGRQNGAF